MIEIRRLRSADSAILSSLLKQSSESDRKYFHPFGFSVDEIRPHLNQCSLDMFVGLFVKEAGELAGFHMLRGLDEGYPSPMYGVFIGASYRRMGLGRLSLSHAIAVCRLHNFPSLLLKVYEDNTSAYRLYQSMGFKVLRKQDGQCVMELSTSEYASR